MAKFPIEGFFAKPGKELRISDVNGQRIFPAMRRGDVMVFIEFNGYRKPVFFPSQPAGQETK